MSDDNNGEASSAPIEIPHHREDPHFEEIENEIRDIQIQVDGLVFGSVFLRKPQGLAADVHVPEMPSEVPNFGETERQMEQTISRMNELEDRLKELLENKEYTCYEDQFDEYMRELEDSGRTLRALKPMLSPELLRDGETGKTDVSWLSWRRNTLGSKLHKESNELLTLIEGSEESDAEKSAESKMKGKLKSAEALLKTADHLQRSAQYLSWFTRKVVDYNESLSEFQRDFTVNLVSQWVQEEVNKVQEHHKNCMNFCSELAQKLGAK